MVGRSRRSGGISRLEKEILARTVALLCSEEDPSHCHRRLLVGWALEARGFTLQHIRGDGSIQTEDEMTADTDLFPETEASHGSLYDRFHEEDGGRILRGAEGPGVKATRRSPDNASQLAGFARRADLPFFLEKLCDAEYVYEPGLAPTREILDAYRNGGGWTGYEREFLDLLRDRRVEETLDRNLFDVPTVLLCSEAGAEHCHRRLVLEYLDREWGGIRALHL